MANLNGWARVLVVIWTLVALMATIVEFNEAEYQIRRIDECVTERAEEVSAAAEYEQRFAEWRAQRPPGLPDDIGHWSGRDLTDEQRQLLRDWEFDRPTQPHRYSYCPDPPNTVSGIVTSAVIEWARVVGIFALVLWGGYTAIAWIIRGFRRAK